MNKFRALLLAISIMLTSVFGSGCEDDPKEDPETPVAGMTSDMLVEAGAAAGESVTSGESAGEEGGEVVAGDQAGVEVAGEVVAGDQAGETPQVAGEVVDVAGEAAGEDVAGEDVAGELPPPAGEESSAGEEVQESEATAGETPQVAGEESPTEPVAGEDLPG